MRAGRRGGSRVRDKCSRAEFLIWGRVVASEHAADCWGAFGGRVSAGIREHGAP